MNDERSDLERLLIKAVRTDPPDDLLRRAIVDQLRLDGHSGLAAEIDGVKGANHLLRIKHLADTCQLPISFNLLWASVLVAPKIMLLPDPPFGFTWGDFTHNPNLDGIRGYWDVPIVFDEVHEVHELPRDRPLVSTGQFGSLTAHGANQVTESVDAMIAAAMAASRSGRTKPWGHWGSPVLPVLSGLVLDNPPPEWREIDE